MAGYFRAMHRECFPNQSLVNSADFGALSA
jgi:hypothetical protein